jgi:hypothetical protein
MHRIESRESRSQKLAARALTENTVRCAGERLQNISSVASVHVRSVRRPDSAAAHRHCFMGLGSSKARKAKLLAEQQAEEERMEQIMLAAEKQARRNSARVVDGMVRKGSIAADDRLKLIEKEQEYAAEEKKVKEKAMHAMWIAGGAVGSKNHHYAGDELKGKRKKAKDDESSDESSDDETKISEAERGVKLARKYRIMVEKHRADLVAQWPTMDGSKEYRDQIEEAQAYEEQVMREAEKHKKGALKDDDDDATRA